MVMAVCIETSGFAMNVGHENFMKLELLWYSVMVVAAGSGENVEEWCY